ncbi:K+/H+ antiporter subunit F [Coralloluteibacterium stylophorae]|uniref:K+/H+ antiporter subunit F n=2 Tax=Coralloluteibacterium stylophorae TaxID=1776034 RepID=A0AAP2CDF6_9GAMM|nr:K+/H+ antiporter subunit F [Coralloluteibacterium stylophorae]MBS7457885.1 K+/H+ antiporter subunit F [Coralloluteibacterium stylophorae]
MIDTAAIIALCLIAAAVLMSLFRLLRGPSSTDRILALDTLYINATALLVVIGVVFATSTYFEAALIIAMLGFVSTMVACKYVIRGRIIE